MAVVERITEERRRVVETYVREFWTRGGSGAKYWYGIVSVLVPREWVGRKVRVTVELVEEGHGV